jgi:hypothetical protein
MNITQPRGASTVSRRQRVGLLDRAAMLGVPLRAFAGAARITLGKGARDQMPRLRLVGQVAASLEGSTGHAYQVQSAGQGRTFDRGHQVGVRLCEGALSRAEEEHSSLARDLRAPQSVHGAPAPAALPIGIVCPQPCQQTVQTPQCGTKTAQLPPIVTGEQIAKSLIHAPAPPYSDVPYFLLNSTLDDIAFWLILAVMLQHRMTIFIGYMPKSLSPSKC